MSDGLGELFSCPLCFSTWVGMIFSIVDVFLIESVALTPFSMILSGVDCFSIAILTVLMDGFFTAGFVWLLHQLEEAMERHGVFYNDELVEEKDDEQQTDGD